MRIGTLWNKLANPKNVPRLFAACLGIILIAGLVIPFELNDDQLYVRPAPQSQMDEGLEEPGIISPQYPENAASLGMITGYMSPIALWIASISPYFGTSIYSSPGGLIDEILYYTRGFDTILESSILMMSFIIASWLAINYTMNRKHDTENIKSDVKKAIVDSSNVAREIKANDMKAHERQNRRDN